MQEKTQITHALKIVEQDQLKLAALSTCVQGGMTNTQKIQQHLDNESVSGRVLRRKLNWLAAPPVQHGFPPLLEMIELKPEGSNGRPAKSYWLTEFGAAVLNMLPNNLDIKAPNIRDPSDLAHRYITLKIAEKAKKDGLEPMVEHRLSNSAQEVRADIYTELDNIPLVVEVEQKLLRQHLTRAREKLIRWARFVQAENSDERWNIQLVFNIRPREEPTLVRYWQEAFNDAQKEFGELPYDLYYINARDLLEPPSFLNALYEAEFFVDENLYTNVRDTAREPEKTRPDDISKDVFFNFQEALDNLLGAPPDRSLVALTELGLLIHTASYYPNSPSLKAAVFPHASIWLLRRYLEDPRMEAVKTELKQSLTRINKRNPGMVMLRETVTGLLWDVLLFHHGLGRGGPLQVVFQVPDFQDRSSDFRVEVRLSDALREKYTEEAKALGWCLGGIYLYRRHLGLIEKKKRS
jgi:hypothetical protein